ncbi:MAG: Uma2 family endonuclease, partial [Nitrospinota bacterium]
KEYWLLDPELRRADFYILGEDGRYQRSIPDRKKVYRSRVLTPFWLRVDWLWQQPLPPILEILKALKVI